MIGRPSASRNGPTAGVVVMRVVRFPFQSVNVGDTRYASEIEAIGRPRIQAPSRRPGEGAGEALGPLGHSPIRPFGCVPLQEAGSTKLHATLIRPATRANWSLADEDAALRSGSSDALIHPSTGRVSHAPRGATGVSVYRTISDPRKLAAYNELWRLWLSSRGAAGPLVRGGRVVAHDAGIARADRRGRVHDSSSRLSRRAKVRPPAGVGRPLRRRRARLPHRRRHRRPRQAVTGTEARPGHPQGSRGLRALGYRVQTASGLVALALTLCRRCGARLRRTEDQKDQAMRGDADLRPVTSWIRTGW